MFNESNVIVNGGADLASTLQTYKTVVLKYNIVDGHNLLTQAMVSHTNTKYVIKWDYELAEDITIPANCVLEFDGGSISASGNGTGKNTINGNFSLITENKCFSGISFANNNTIFPIIAFVRNCRTFDINVDCYNELVYALTCGAKTLSFRGDEKFYTSQTIEVETDCDIIGRKPQVMPTGDITQTKNFCGIWTDRDISILKIIYDSRTAYAARSIKGFALSNNNTSFASETQKDVALLEVTTLASTVVWGLDIDVDIHARRTTEDINNQHQGYRIEKYHYTGIRIYPTNGGVITQMLISGNMKGCYQAYDIGKRVGDTSSSWTTWTFINSNTWVAELGYFTAGPIFIDGAHQAASCFLEGYPHVFVTAEAPFYIYGNLMDVGVTRTIYHKDHPGDNNYRLGITTANIGVEDINKGLNESHKEVSIISSSDPVLNYGLDYTQNPTLDSFKLFGATSNVLSQKFVNDNIVEFNNLKISNSDDANAEGYQAFDLPLVCPDYKKIFCVNNLLRENNPVNGEEYNADRCTLVTRNLTSLGATSWEKIYISFDIVIDTKKIGGLNKLNRFVLQNLGWCFYVNYVGLDDNKQEIANSKILNIVSSTDPFARIFSYGGISTFDSNIPLYVCKYPQFPGATPSDVFASYVKFTFVYYREFADKQFLCPALGLIGNISNNYTQDGGSIYDEVTLYNGLIRKTSGYNIYNGKEEKTFSPSNSYADYSQFLKCYYRQGIAQTIYILVHDLLGRSSVLKISIGATDYRDINIGLKGDITEVRFRVLTYDCNYLKYIQTNEYMTLTVENSYVPIFIDNIISTGEIVFSEYNYKGTYNYIAKIVTAPSNVGSFDNKPTGDIFLGYEYFCTDRQTEEGQVNGIPIYYKGQDTTDPNNPVDIWVDALGRVVS